MIRHRACVRDVVLRDHASASGVMRCRVCSPVWKSRPRSARRCRACAAACRARAGSIRKIITSPCASSAISTTSRARDRLAAGPGQPQPFEVRFRACRLSAAASRAPWSPRVEPIRPLMELQAELERLMQRIGLEPEGRKFTPHVTLARLRDASSRDVADYLSARGYFPSRVFRRRALCCSPRAPRSAAGLMWSRIPTR